LLEKIRFVRKNNTFCFNVIFQLKFAIAFRAKNRPSTLITPNSLNSSHIKSYLSKIKNTFHQIGPMFGVKGFGPISTYRPITNYDFGPLTQQIGLASRCISRNRN